MSISENVVQKKLMFSCVETRNWLGDCSLFVIKIMYILISSFEFFSYLYLWKVTNFNLLVPGVQ